MTSKAIIFHGTGNNSQGNWIPWLKVRLEEKNWEVYTPDLPDSDYPDARKWAEFAIKNVPFVIDEQTVVIGHSSGASLIPQFLQLLPPGTRLKKAVLVAGFHTDLGWEKLKAAQNVPVDYDEVKKKAGEFIFIHSDNDPYVPLEEAQWLVDKLGGGIKLITGQGHFNLEASPKYQEFPKLLAIILAERQLVIGAVYQHFKGDYYLVREIVMDSETQAKMVLYQPLYGNGEIPSYVRPLEMFLSEVDREKYPEAKQKYRFELADVKSKNHG